MTRRLTVFVVAVLVAAACSSTPADDSSSATTAAPTTSEASTTTVTVATTTVATATTTTEGITLLLTSPSFEQSKGIPREFSCDGANVSPQLNIENVPDNTVTLALIVDDPDAPGGTWVHWVAFDFPPTETIPEGIPLLGIGGTNSWGVTGYGGPCPPSGTHRYFFKLFALDGTLELPEGSTKEDVLEAMEGRILDQTELVGTYTRP